MCLKNYSLVFLVLLVILGCRSKTESTTSAPATDMSLDEIEKIDVHAHFQHDRDYLPDFLDKWNMQAVLVDVFHEDSTGTARSFEKYRALAKIHPERFYLCTAIIGTGIDAPDYADKMIAQLSDEIDAGARMVKVWKNFGMVTKDDSGNFIQIDDPRLQPIWDFLKKEHIPMMAHIGEPLQAWRKLDPRSPHFGYYTEHPEYHAFNFPEIPSYETIIAARDHWIESNPDLPILCAHLGSMSHDVGMVAQRLDKYPNMYVETAARFGDLARQDSDVVRSFFIKYQDRILFGSDFGNQSLQETMTGDEVVAEKSELNFEYDVLWRYLSGKDSLEVKGQMTRGLGLSTEVLKKVYAQNAVNFMALD
tara:strand:- start:1304 stop:2392 length:1089 start_codon:yes stop_codon:yes gene_type:complete